MDEDAGRDGGRPDEQRRAEAVERLEDAAALCGEEHEADEDERLNVSWSDILGEIERVKVKAMGAPAPALPVDRFEDGCRIYESCEREAGGREILDMIHALAHKHGDGRLSRRMIRRVKPAIIEWARERQLLWFEPQDCASCGERFHPQRVHDHLPSYCSNVCRQRAYRARKREKLELDREEGR